MALSVDPYVIELDRWLINESSKWVKVIRRFEGDDWDRMHEDFIIRSGGTNDAVEIEKNRASKPKNIASKVSSHEKTLALLKEKRDIRDIAKERGMTLGTIISHLEKLKEEKYDLDIKHYAPKSGDLKVIQAAFESLGGTKLSPVYKKLKGKYSYDDIRLARLFI